MGMNKGAGRRASAAGSLNRGRVSMARYGRDFDRDRWGMRGNEGGSTGGFYGGSDQFGAHWRGGQGQQAQGSSQWSGGQDGGVGARPPGPDDWGGGGPPRPRG